MLCRWLVAGQQPVPASSEASAMAPRPSDVRPRNARRQSAARRLCRVDVRCERAMSVPRHRFVQVEDRPRDAGPGGQLGATARPGRRATGRRQQALARPVSSAGKASAARRPASSASTCRSRGSSGARRQRLRARPRRCGRASSGRAFAQHAAGEHAGRFDVGRDRSASTSAACGVFDTGRSAVHSSRLGASKASRLGCRNVRCQCVYSPRRYWSGPTSACQVRLGKFRNSQ